MKLRFLAFYLLAGLVLATPVLAQGPVVIFQELDQILTDLCTDGLIDPAGTPLPDGTLLKLYWDNDNNGPDDDDPQPTLCDDPPVCETGPSFTCNYNELPMNGEELLGQAGQFFDEQGWRIVGGLLSPSRFYFRICLPNSRIVSNVFSVVAGPQDIDPTWTCSDTVCPGCLTALAPQAVEASENSCDMVTITWTYPADETAEVTEFDIYRGTAFLQTVPRTGENYSVTDNGGEIGQTYNYRVEAVRYCPAPVDTSYATGSDPGQRPLAPPVPADVVVSSIYCDSVVVTWTYASNSGVDSFIVKRDGVRVGAIQAIGSPGARRFRHSGAPAGVAVYTVVGRNQLCGEGQASAPLNGNNIDQVPVANVSASDDQPSSVIITWTDSATETGYQVWRSDFDGSNPSSIGTVGANIVTFTDPNCTQGVTKRYWVIATSGCGLGDPSLFDNGSCGGGPPPVPQNVNATDGTSCDNVVITWNDVVTEDGYRVFRNGSQIAEVGADVVTYTDVTADVLVIYNYTVASFNTSGQSNQSTANTGFRNGVPAQPTGLVASTNSCFGVALTWTALPNNTTFHINRDGTDIATNVLGGATSYFDSAATVGNHVYIIHGVNVCGEGPNSAPANGTRLPGAPDQPQNFAASDGQCDGTHLTWTDVATETSYQIWRAASDGSGPAQIATNSAGDITYDDLTGAAATIYRYWVVAVNACGNSAPSAFDNGSRNEFPPVPTGLVASDNTDCAGVVITWNDVSGETSYTLVRDGVDFVTGIAANQITYTDATATAGQVYEYRVRSVNSCGASAPSNSDNGQRRSVPGQVTGVSASDNDCQRVLVAWSALANTDSFQVRRDGIRVGSTLGGVNLFSDVSAAVGVTYAYTVVAYNACGAGAVSNPNNGQRISGALPAVTNVQATTNICDSIRVTWNDIAGEDSFQVRRDGVRIAVRSVNVTIFYDVNVVIGQNYSYTVVAYNECGEGSTSIPAVGSLAPRPNAPANFTAQQDCPTITLTWSVVTGSSGYTLTRDGNIIAVIAHPNNSYVDDPGDNAPHVYVVRAANACGLGAASTVNAQRQGNTPAPTNLVADQPACGVVLLTWTATDGTNGTIVFRDGSAIDTIDIGVDRFIDSPSGGEHVYYVTAYSFDCGTSAPSASVTVNVTNPSILSQRFNQATLPPGWTVVHLGTTTMPWHIVNEGLGDFAPSVGLEGFASSALEYLVSPIIDFTGASGLSLSFVSDMRNNPGAFGYVEASLDGGATWPYSLMTIIGNEQFVADRHLSVVFNHATQARFRWKFTGSASQPATWSIDDVRICATVESAPAPATISGLHVTGDEDGSIALCWNAIPSLFFGAYELTYGLNEDLSGETVTITREMDWQLGEPGCGGTVVGNLDVQTPYYFAVRWTDIYGNISELSDIVNGIPQPESNGPLLSNPNPDGGIWWGEYTGRVSFGLSDVSVVDLSTMEYRVDRNGDGVYDESADEAWRSAGLEGSLDGDGEFNVDLTFAAEGAQLRYELRVTDQWGNIGYSGSVNQEGVADDWSVRIDMSEPQPLENFATSNFSDDHIVQLVWLPSEDISASHYEIFFGNHPEITENDLLWNAEDDATLANAEQYYTSINGLDARTTYYFRMRAIDALGHIGQWSEEISVTTNGITSHEIDDVTVAVVLAGERDLAMQLSWEPITSDENGNPVVAVYRVYASDNPEFVPGPEYLVGEVAATELLLPVARGIETNSIFKVIADTRFAGDGDTPTRIAPNTGR